MKSASVIGALLLISTIALADQPVYTTKLENGWENWSWAKTKLAGPTISVTSKPWEGLYFHHKPQKSALFTAITFSVNGGKTGGQKLQLMATVKGKPIKAALLPAIAPGQWTKISIPIAQLGIKGQEFDGFWIQSQAATTYSVQSVSLKNQ